MKGSLSIALSQTNTRGASTTLDNAIITFSEGSALGKFYFGEQDANIYLPQGNEDYAIVCASRDGVHTVSTTTEIPLNFKANKDGEYTLTVSAPLTSNLSTLTLIDNLTGANIDLLETPSYTFTARTTDYASRFKLVFNDDNNNIDPEGNDDFAFIDGDGNLIVNGDGLLQVFDVLGHQLPKNRYRIKTVYYPKH